MYAGQHDDALADYSHATELDPTDPGLWRQRAHAHTIAPTPDWQNALVDINSHIELFPGHDPGAYKLRAWIHENLGNDTEAERDRRLAQQPS